MRKELAWIDLGPDKPEQVRRVIGRSIGLDESLGIDIPVEDILGMDLSEAAFQFRLFMLNMSLKELIKQGNVTLTEQRPRTVRRLVTRVLIPPIGFGQFWGSLYDIQTAQIYPQGVWFYRPMGINPDQYLNARDLLISTANTMLPEIGEIDPFPSPPSRVIHQPDLAPDPAINEAFSTLMRQFKNPH